LSETKNGLPQQPESTQDNDTTSKPKLRCPINKYVLACREDCAWYTETTYRRGCALTVIAQVLVYANETLSMAYDRETERGGRL
jgi:hypothetical protein